MIIDLRSDTVTKPTPGMRRAIAEADVGDDVYGEDPTVKKLEERIATLLGKEAALFVTSGTMGNQLCIKAQTNPGDEVILERGGHTFVHESGALAGLSFVQAQPIDGERGILSVDAVKRAIRPPAYYFARSKVLIAENTSNSGGGTIYPVERLHALGALAREHELRFHLDGARLFNAHVASGVALSEIAAPFDSASVCLSKGLGAPFGSVIAGSRATITAAHRLRKMWGGGMRQVGILAAGGIYALDHHVERLADDHRNLRRLTEGLSKIDGLEAPPELFPTNIAYVTTKKIGAAELCARLKKVGVLASPTGPNEFRLVTHLDVSTAAIDEAIARIKTCV